MEADIGIKKKGVEIEVIGYGGQGVLNQGMGDNMVSLPMFQDESQAIQTNDNTKEEEQAYEGNHDIPQYFSLSIIRCYKCQGEGHIARECLQRR